MNRLCKNNDRIPQEPLFHAYIINLEGAAERWADSRSSIEALEIPYVRIKGIQGDQLPLNPTQYNRIKYNISHGKKTNPREVGCYLSHIKALQTFLQSNDDYGLILEDDIALPSDSKKLVEAVIPYAEHWDMIRLSAHAPGKPLPFANLPEGRVLAYNLKVLKNTGAYLVNRHAAQCICERMLPMSLPYDVALDRDWRYGFKTAYISPPAVLVNYELPSQIPPAKKIRFFRSTTFHLFHGVRHVQRRLYRKRYHQQAMRTLEL